MTQTNAETVVTDTLLETWRHPSAVPRRGSRFSTWLLGSCEIESVDVAASNIGRILYKKGDRAGAITYAERALPILEKAHSAEHPKTKQAREGLEHLRRGEKEP